MRAHRLLAVVCCAALLTVFGCSSREEKTVKAGGKLVKGGSPYNPTADIKGSLPPEDPGIRVVFTRADGDKQGAEFPAVVDKSAGTFEVPGNAGKGIPPGRYKVKVFVGVFTGAAQQPSDSAIDKIPLEYRTEAQKNQTSPAFSLGAEMASEEVDVTDGGANDFTIEIKGPKKK